MRTKCQWEIKIGRSMNFSEGEFKTKTLKTMRNQTVHLFVVRTFQAEGRTSDMLLRQEWDKEKLTRRWLKKARENIIRASEGKNKP